MEPNWVVYSAYVNESGCIDADVYGPFATEALAEVWRRHRLNPPAFLLAQVHLYPDATRPNFLQAIHVDIGTPIVVQFAYTSRRQTHVSIWGGFSGPGEARAWVAAAGRFANNYQASEVLQSSLFKPQEMAPVPPVAPVPAPPKPQPPKPAVLPVQFRR
jgi:hypothetical protein